MLGLAVWSLVALSLALWSRVGRARDRRAAVGAGVHVVGGRAQRHRLAGAGPPGDARRRPTAWLAGTGLTTNPVIVQDLAFWLPADGLAGWGVWKARPPAVALAAAGLVFWVVESLGVAVDQWWGHQADPSSTWASTGAVVMFAALALVGLLPTLRLLHAVPDAAGPTMTDATSRRAS